MSNTAERHYKLSESLSRNDTYKLEKFLKKYNSKVNSRQFQRNINRKWRDYNKKDDTEKDNIIKAGLLTKELTKYKIS